MRYVPLTEAEWLTGTDWLTLFAFARPFLSERKQRLLWCHQLRRHRPAVGRPCDRALVELAEAYADGRARREELEAAHARALAWKELILAMDFEAIACARSVTDAARVPLGDGVWGTPSLLREFVGNPFRPVRVEPAWLRWAGGTVVKLAQAIYEERAFDRLPILADALEEAGCDNGDILAHLRSPGPHVRGCWAVDLLTGRQ
jgi:hypothetical protein